MAWKTSQSLSFTSYYVATGVRVLADKVYCSKANEERLRSQGLVSGIQRKDYRHKPLRTRAKRYHQFIGRSGYKIARMFGSIKRWLGGLEARYVGLSKTHGQHVLGLLCPDRQLSRPGPIVR